MIIHLAGSVSHLEEDLPYFRAITQAIHENGDVLALNWFEPASGKNVESTHPANWPAVLDAYIEAATKADLLVIEATQYRFGIGYFLAYAIENKKPTLLVSRTPLKGRSISGISSQYLRTHTYKTAEELAGITTDFLKENSFDAQDFRFNFFIDRQIYNFLRDKSYETGKNKSEIIRELLDREIGRGGSR